eukprot:5555827-Pyramimonas_sp.AAC.1
MPGGAGPRRRRPRCDNFPPAALMVTRARVRVSLPHWVQDLLAWSVLVTDVDNAQQCAAVIFNLGGAARELARAVSFAEMTEGGVVNG